MRGQAGKLGFRSWLTVVPVTSDRSPNFSMLLQLGNWKLTPLSLGWVQVQHRMLSKRNRKECSWIQKIELIVVFVNVCGALAWGQEAAMVLIMLDFEVTTAS